MKNRRLFTGLGLGVSLFVLVSFTDPGERTFEIMKNLDIFATLFKELNAYYVDDLNPNRTMRNSIDAMLKNLDPYTVFYPEDDIEDYMTMNTGKYNGIGVVTQNRQNKMFVTLILEGTPAEKSELKIGDEIIKIDGIDISRPNTNVDKLMKGQTGSAVKLTVKRFGETASREVSVTRDVVKMTNVPYFGMIDNETGYIDLKDFTQTASKDFRAAFQDLEKKGMKKLVIDLRDNPGGLLTMAVDIANVFIPKGSEVVATKGKIAEWNKTYTALNQPLNTEIPIAVLTNGRSASAAEIVAGVLQDYDRAVLVGQKSFGKGLVQITRDLSYNCKLKITTAKYYIPSGRCIQAIDYSHRNPDGSAAKLPDSLRRAFTTKSGRTVYDGGGITPDLPVLHPSLAAITQSLLKNGLIFEYANKFRFENPTPLDGRTYSLPDAEYQKFTAWLAGKDYDYTTEAERKLAELEASAKKEQYLDGMQETLRSLKTKLSHSKEQDLQKFKTEIQYLLEQEIIVRYQLQKGVRELSFSKDPELREALRILSYPVEYNALLKGNK